MKFTLSRLQIDDAIALGATSLGRFAGVQGRYNNTFNSHTLGRFGEIAVASLFQMSGYKISPHYRDAGSLKLCDVEVLGPVPYPRLEVKTWGLANWLDLGRCIQVGQIAKITESADAIVWCTVPLPYLNSANDLSGYSTLDVEFVGFSLPPDIMKAPIRLTGRPKRRQVENYQVSQSDLRDPLGLLSS